MADLKIQDLHKYYGDNHVVKGVNLEIPEGKFIVLVGQSGCGKSTLLRTIAGLESVDQGSIEIAGHVKSGLTLKVNVLDNEISAFASSRDGRVQRSLLRQRPEPQHVEELLLELRASVLPVFFRPGEIEFATTQQLGLLPQMTLDQRIANRL